MIILKLAADTRKYLEILAQQGVQTGFIPTMGALHDGHISLIRQSRARGLFSIASIFVNPTQFNNPEDFEKYPVTIDRDIDLLEASGCDLLFLPATSEIYPSDYKKIHYDLGYLESILEGPTRPGHFQGVCQVVDRLLEIVRPDMIFLGRKDYQQCMVITRLIALTGRNTSVCIGETIRENSGLAMSSRNARLSEAEKEQATLIYKVLQEFRVSLKPGPLKAFKEAGAHKLTAAGFQVDYVELADAESLQILETWDGHTSVVGLIAAFLGRVRLIDNEILYKE